MNDKAQNQQLSDVVAPLLSEPVPIFLREEAGVRLHAKGNYFCTIFNNGKPIQSAKFIKK